MDEGTVGTCAALSPVPKEMNYVSVCDEELPWAQLQIVSVQGKLEYRVYPDVLSCRVLSTQLKVAQTIRVFIS